MIITIMISRAVLSLESFCSNKHFPEMLAPFLTFAETQEANMIWPVSASDAKDYVMVTDDDKAMLNLYYTLAFADMWKRKAPNVNVYPGNSCSFSFSFEF